MLLVEVIKPIWTVFEFLKQNEEIVAERARIAEEVFGLISNLCNYSDIVRYNYAKVESLFNLSITNRYSMKQLEKIRMGSNKFFPTEKKDGLKESSMVNLAQVLTTDKSRLIKKLGQMGEDKMGEVHEAIKVSLGLK